jgi:hypothetical protein
MNYILAGIASFLIRGRIQRVRFNHEETRPTTEGR